MYDQDCKDDCLKGYLELMPCMTNEGFNCVSMVVDQVELNSQLRDGEAAPRR